MPSTDIHTVDDVRALLAYALAECLMGDNSLLRVRALVAIAAAYLEIVKVGELEQRLAAVEAALRTNHRESYDTH